MDLSLMNSEPNDHWLEILKYTLFAHLHLNLNPTAK